VSEAKLEFGDEVSDREGKVGQLTRVVLDPTNRTASFVVVVPDDVATTARLVPIEIVTSESSSELLLTCSRAEFMALEDAVEYDRLPSGPVGDALGMVLSETEFRGTGVGYVPGPTDVVRNRIPEGLVAMERLQDVEASDGRIGQMSGVCIDLSDHRLTRIVVAEGHLWARKRVTLPIGSVADVGEAVRLAISGQQAKTAAQPYP